MAIAFIAAIVASGPMGWAIFAGLGGGSFVCYKVGQKILGG
jgi:hypothetical protein